MAEPAASVVFYFVFGSIVLIGFGAWCVAATNMVKAMRGIRPNRKWGMYVPVVFLFPSFFTDEGNIARERHLKAVGVFVLALVGVFGVGWLREWLLASG